MELWISMILFSISSFALHIDTGYRRFGISSPQTDNIASLIAKQASGYPHGHQDRKIGQGNQNNRAYQDAYDRIGGYPEISENRLQRRAGGKRSKSNKRKQIPGSDSPNGASGSQLRRQRSGSSFYHSNSASANSLGVEGGISKPQTPNSRMPKRGSNAQFGSSQSSEMLHSLLGGQLSARPSQNSLGDLGLHEVQQHFPGNQPGLRDDRARLAGPSIPIQLHAFPAHHAFGGHMAPPPSPTQQNSHRSRMSDSAMAVDLSDTAQGPSKFRKMSAVNDLTMMDAWPASPARGRSGGSSMSMSAGGASSGGMLSP